MCVGIEIKILLVIQSNLGLCTSKLIISWTAGWTRTSRTIIHSVVIFLYFDARGVQYAHCAHVPRTDTDCCACAHVQHKLNPFVCLACFVCMTAALTHILFVMQFHFPFCVIVKLYFGFVHSFIYVYLLSYCFAFLHVTTNACICI